MRTISFHQFPAGEQAAFRSSCTRWRKQPDEFLVEGQDYDLRWGPPNLRRREVIVVHYPSLKGKRYQTGPASNWNVAFDRDLRAGLYSHHRLQRSPTMRASGHGDLSRGTGVASASLNQMTVMRLISDSLKIQRLLSRCSRASDWRTGCVCISRGTASCGKTSRLWPIAPR